jgi:hypothetical protein
VGCFGTTSVADIFDVEVFRVDIILRSFGERFDKKSAGIPNLRPIEVDFQRGRANRFAIVFCWAAELAEGLFFEKKFRSTVIPTTHAAA